MDISRNTIGSAGANWISFASGDFFLDSLTFTSANVPKRLTSQGRATVEEETNNHRRKERLKREASAKLRQEYINSVFEQQQKQQMYQKQQIESKSYSVEEHIDLYCDSDDDGKHLFSYGDNAKKMSTTYHMDIL